MGNQLNQRIILQVETKLQDAGKAFRDLATQGEQANKRIGKAAQDAANQQAKVAQDVGKKSADFLAGAVRFGGALQLGTAAVNGLAIAFNKSIPASEKFSAIIGQLPFGIGQLGQAFQALGDQISGQAERTRQEARIGAAGETRAGVTGAEADARRRIRDVQEQRARRAEVIRGVSPVAAAEAAAGRAGRALAEAQRRAAEARAGQQAGAEEIFRLRTDPTRFTRELVPGPLGALGQRVERVGPDTQAIAREQARIEVLQRQEAEALRDIEVERQRVLDAQLKREERLLEIARERARLARAQLRPSDVAGEQRIEAELARSVQAIRAATAPIIDRILQEQARFFIEQMERSQRAAFDQLRRNQPRP